MFKVQMKHVDANDVEEGIIFDCQYINFNLDGYKFKNIVIDNCVVDDFEVNNKDIASIRIR